jgi:hypothetical protein
MISSLRPFVAGRPLTHLAGMGPSRHAVEWYNALLLRTRDEAGNVTELLPIAGNVSESVFQPEWSPDGRVIFFASDRRNWWNLDRFELASRTSEPLAPMKAEFGVGASTYACVGPDRIVCAYSTGSLGQLAVLDLKHKVLQPLETPFTEFSFVRADTARMRRTLLNGFRLFARIIKFAQDRYAKRVRRRTGRRLGHRSRRDGVSR